MSKWAIGTGVAILCKVNADPAPDASGGTHDKCDQLQIDHCERLNGMLGVLWIMLQPKLELLCADQFPFVKYYPMMMHATSEWSNQSERVVGYLYYHPGVELLGLPNFMITHCSEVLGRRSRRLHFMPEATTMILHFLVLADCQKRDRIQPQRQEFLRAWKRLISHSFTVQ